MSDKLSQKLSQIKSSGSQSNGAIPFPVDDEDPNSQVRESPEDQGQGQGPRRKSFLENNNPGEFLPAPRKKRVSSLSLSDQFTGMTPLHADGSQSHISRHGSTASRGGDPLSRRSSRSRKGSMALRHHKSVIDHERVASYAFAFDIDGVLVKGPETIPQAPEALRMLNGHNKYNIKVPYIFITNGGGRSEKARCRDLSKRLGITVTEDQVIQGHTPMKDLVDVYDNVLVVGGVLDSCRNVAEGYGFKNVYIPLDIMKWKPSVTPYYVLNEEEKKVARDVDFSKVNIQAILVFADSRNWAADQQIILELLLSDNGVMGTVCPTYDNGPGLYFAHSDFVWATDYGLSRYGMGALQVSIAALYQEHTGKELQVTRFGKPQRGTFRFAEKVLSNWRRETLSEHVENLKLEEDQSAGETPFDTEEEDEEEDDDEDDTTVDGEKPGDLVLELPPASTVYFVGDTPESDIRFANSHDSTWYSILVKTGVYKDGAMPRYTPKKTCENVLEAVKFAIEREHAKELKEWNESCIDGPAKVQQQSAKKGGKDQEGSPLTTEDIKSIKAQASS
ncbi:(ZYRO0A09394g) [Zygosaccharomyces parabailii]|uniref:BN860_14048g1_1 n=1 Tax=Zygosaccharomyces bailii (strain CLIB 213 / ATCC 58445 / CBS 680 / BCRC 21525 / NBRC 1098 / NCYC 1416 / NRRL Y-2227) TaxID=1333698 RepID=A0A8J2X6A3_ZYGB2|nr:(ZYRO0A09394g) [Zygosaccharomyces parabailii]CDF87768.1 BN860_14048g1_1 [Zygosaccharomyces bailii CLIB 213]